MVEAIGNKGLLVSSGFVAGEALMGLVLAALVAAEDQALRGRHHRRALWATGSARRIIVFLGFFMVNRSISAVNDPLPAGEPTTRASRR